MSIEGKTLSYALLHEPLQLPNLIVLPAGLSRETSGRQRGVEMTIEGTNVVIVAQNSAGKVVTLAIPQTNFKAMVLAE